MATIIPLNPQHRAVTAVSIGDPPPPCQIVIFPGVRIEREDTSTGSNASGPEPDGADRSNRPRKSS